jgi:AcrR family transcriptional regulator
MTAGAPQRSDRGPKYRRGDAARTRLLDVATELFRARGINRVGVDEIVAESGVAKSTLYRWFPTKDDLVIAFLDRRDELFWQQWDRVASKHRDARDHLLDQLRWISKYLDRDNVRGCPFLNTTAEVADPADRIRFRCAEHKRQLRDRLRETCGQLGIDRAERLADQLVLIIDGAFADSEVFGAGGPHLELERCGAALIAAFTKRDA